MKLEDIKREDFENKDDFIKAKLKWIDENRHLIEYISGEESKDRIKAKCKRLGLKLNLE